MHVPYTVVALPLSLLNDDSFIIKPTSFFWHSLATTRLSMLSTVTSKKRLSRHAVSVGLSFLLFLFLACSDFIMKLSSRLNQRNLFSSLSKEDLTGDLGLSRLQAKKVLLEMEIAHELTSDAGDSGGGADPEDIKRLEEELQAKNAEIVTFKAMLQAMQPTEPEAVDLQMIDTKHAQVTLRNETRTTQRPNVTAQAPGPLLPYNTTGRVFVCITGQVQRLVPTRIKETILEPLRQKGYEVDIALIVSEGRSHSTNGREGLRMFDTYQNSSRFFSSSGFSVVTDSSITQPDHPIVPPNYLRLMDKVKMTESWQRARVQNHARQFETLTKCYDALLLTTERRYNANISFESSPTKYYDFSIRLREDVSLQEPLDVDKLLPLLYPSSTSGETVLGTDCRIHGGMNDRMALVSREAIKNYYEGPWKFFSQADPDLNSTSFKHSVHNPESFLYYVYKTRLNMTVVRTPKLRGIIKYTIRNDGTQEHPNLVVVPAPLEDNEMCPKD